MTRGKAHLLAGEGVEARLADLVGLPEYPLVVFEHSPLVLALCQVRFAPVLGLGDPTFVAHFQCAIQEQYPLVAQDEVGLQVSLAGGGLDLQHDLQRQRRWQFTDPTETWTVVLAPNFLALETREYRHFTEFLERLGEVIDALIEHVRPTFGLRLGLRYINEIRPQRSLTWSEVIRPELLGVLSESPFSERVVQMTQQIALRYEGDQGITLQHGLLPRGTTVRPRGEEPASEESFYLLDIDAYRTFPPTAPLPMDRQEICAHVEAFNRAVYRVFRWSVTDRYIETLGVREHVDR